MKRFYFGRLITPVLAASFLPVFCLNAGAQAAGPTVVQLNAGDIQGDSSNAAVLKLAAALRQYPHANLLRVSWTVSIGGWGSDATALYDRRRKAVEFYCVGGEQFDGTIHEHYRYSGVTDDVLHRLAAKWKNAAGGTSDGFFNDLTSFGCRRYLYRDNWKTTHDNPPLTKRRG